MDLQGRGGHQRDGETTDGTEAGVLGGAVSDSDRGGSGLAPNVNRTEDAGARCGDVTPKTGQTLGSDPLTDKEALSAHVHVCTLVFIWLPQL